MIFGLKDEAYIMDYRLEMVLSIRRLSSDLDSISSDIDSLETNCSSTKSSCDNAESSCGDLRNKPSHSFNPMENIRIMH
jgi:hypothetical protein